MSHNCNKKMSDPRSKGRTQISIGIIAGVLLLFSRSIGLLNGDRVAFNIFGYAAILMYVIFVLSKKLRGAQISFLLCLFYFLLVLYSNITSLYEEWRIGGITTGLCIAQILIDLPAPTIELGLLVQGLLGLRKQAVIGANRISPDRTLGTGEM